MKDMKEAHEMARIKSFEIQLQILLMNSPYKTGVKRK